jgi:hypothetical protein
MRKSEIRGPRSLKPVPRTFTPDAVCQKEWGAVATERRPADYFALRHSRTAAAMAADGLGLGR